MLVLTLRGIRITRHGVKRQPERTDAPSLAVGVILFELNDLSNCPAGFIFASPAQSSP